MKKIPLFIKDMCCILLKNNHTLLFMYVNISVIRGFKPDCCRMCLW